MSEDLTGRRLGHYRVDGVIGKGGMSVMYRATDVRLGRKVALKVIAEHLTGDPEFRERFVDEARNTSAIDHSHVVPLYDFGETDGLLYIAMRYVEGADLATVVKDGPLAPARVIALLSQVAEALDSLHGRGLVHLDVKPANVLVTTRESVDVEHVYLADFGLTRRGATGHRTSSGDFLGSPTYAAPEHLRGEPVDPRTDQYALACVMFACLTGRPPFRGKVPEVIQGHLNGTPPAVSAQVDLPTSIDDVVRRGMSKDLRARYAHCREFVAAARQALSGLARPGVPAARRPDAPPPGPGRSGGSGPSGPSGPSGSVSGPSGPSSPGPGGPAAQPAPTAPTPQPPSGAARAGIAGESVNGPGGIPTQGGSGRGAPPRPPGPGGPLQAGPAQHAQPPHGQTSGPPSGSGPPRQPPRRPAGPPPPPLSSAAPMRLRDPLPAGVPSFATRDARDRPWLLPLSILLGLLVIAGIVVALVVFGGGDDEPPPPQPTVQMDDGGQTLPSDLQVPTR